ncbi:MAG: hypothetical protein CVU66_00715 [Deltaproteobacteria bacterium HGW-Deltaproteobacteria-23]|nr:MAG: hypothetical protein CVU66_00715 [Deltaproteobacteria bacterium HGW-Deltaproteobacteria-23]
MGPLLPLVAVAVALGLLFENSNKKSSELSLISRKDIYKSYCKKILKSSKPAVTRTHITRSINTIMAEYPHFKIGKTGNPNARQANHHVYSKMFLITESKYPDIISQYEREYNDRYAGTPGCDNIRGGSAGPISEISGKYYLYVVVR